MNHFQGQIGRQLNGNARPYTALHVLHSASRGSAELLPLLYCLEQDSMESRPHYRAYQDRGGGGRKCRLGHGFIELCPVGETRKSGSDSSVGSEKSKLDAGKLGRVNSSGVPCSCRRRFDDSLWMVPCQRTPRLGSPSDRDNQ